MHRPCPFMVTAAVVGGAALLAVVYYYWSRPKKSSCCQGGGSTPSTSSSSNSEYCRAGAGMETMEMFRFEDEQVRKVCEKLFLEQMDLGEEYMKDEETAELGAVHISNAIALTGETAQLLKVLRGSIPPANFACIQKYLPTAEMRVNQLLQDELSVTAIEENFG